MKKQVRRLVVLALVVGMLATSVLGTSAAFDPVYYAAQNPDVVKALGNSPAMLKLHYDMFGRKEARMSNKNDVEGQLRRLFNADDYAKLFPDVKKAFGDDKEAMFNHYIAFGLLEGRRPSEKVSQATAVSLKNTVEKAMKDAGLTAKPGSVEVVAAITGETSSVASAGAAVQQTVAKVADVVAKEVAATVEKVQNPKPAPSGGGSSTPAEDLSGVMTALAEAVEAVSGNDLSGNDCTFNISGNDVVSGNEGAYEVDSDKKTVKDAALAQIQRTISNNDLKAAWKNESQVDVTIESTNYATVKGDVIISFINKLTNAVKAKVEVPKANIKVSVSGNSVSANTTP